MPKCKKCGEVFKTSQQLKVHQWGKHGGSNPFISAAKQRRSAKKGR